LAQGTQVLQQKCLTRGFRLLDDAAVIVNEAGDMIAGSGAEVEIKKGGQWIQHEGQRPFSSETESTLFRTHNQGSECRATKL